MGQKVNAAAVQFKLKLADYKNRISFQNKVTSIMDEIRLRIDNSLPLLVAFPEHIGTPMLLFNSYNIVYGKKSLTEAAQSLILSNLLGVLGYKLKFGASFARTLILSKSLEMEKQYQSIFSSAAKKYNAYIAAGSITLAETITNGKTKIKKGNVYNISCFFGPDGNIIGKQKKVHLADSEDKGGLNLVSGALNDLKVFETPFGKVGIAIGLDAFKDDILEILKNKGTDILIQPSANSKPWNQSVQNGWKAGCYDAVYIKKLYKYAINPMINGRLFNLNFQGQSSIISSSDTKIKTNYSALHPVDGFINLAQSHSSEEVLISTIEI